MSNNTTKVYDKQHYVEIKEEQVGAGYEIKIMVCCSVTMMRLSLGNMKAYKDALFFASAKAEEMNVALHDNVKESVK